MDYFNSINTPGKTSPEIPKHVPTSSIDSPASNENADSRISASSPAANSQPTSHHASASSGLATRIRRRNRMITSCLECRRRKLKCSKSHPCTNCVKFQRDCVFLAPALDQASQLKLTEIKEKVGSLERLLERDVARNSGQNSTSSPSQERALPDDADDDLPGNEDEEDLEPTPLAVVDAAYEVDGDDDDLLDLGIQLGKMRITERIGGFFRPKIAEELEYTMSDTYMTGDKSKDEGKVSAPQIVVPLPPAAEWLKAGPQYILPTSGFFFGGSGSQASLIDFLPSRIAADKLIKQYFKCVHPICQTIHRPTFETEWDTFWDEVTLGIEPPSSVQTIVFATMFSGVVSMEDSDISREFGVSKASLVDNFKLGTETALARANFLRTTKIEVLQAFVMYLIPLCRAEMSRAHSVLVGAAIRMAECMGLHRDGSTYGMNPLETHVRRLVWHQLCLLDIRTCEAQGPRPTIRRDEFDTKLPLNVNDVDVHPTGKAPAGEDKWTDTTFSLIRFEINEMMRTIWIDRPRIERKKISLTAVLSKIETFRANMAAKYDHLMDDKIPLQKCAKLVKALSMSRLHIMVLHRYHNSIVAPMPDRLRNIMLASGTTTIETAVALETRPDLKPWSWYGGAYQQYHTAFLLLMEIYVYPQRKEADRIWKCLDYIFETDASLPRREKGKKILMELQQKTAVYQSMRGMRAPVMMQKHAGQREPRVSDNDAPKDMMYDSPEPEHRSSKSQEPTLDQEAQSALPGIPPVNSGQSSGPGAAVLGLGLGPVARTTIGRVPVGHDMQFSGVSNGQSLWAFPNSQSPEASSDTTSLSGQQYSGASVGAGGVAGVTAEIPGQQDDLMADIDWDAFDALFPPGRSLAEPVIPGFPLNASQY
ncbi:probable binuclear zinc cluster transcription factor that regulates the ratio between aurofusarin and rubrofusarin biosynthesis [Rhynchosporium secalis]|uniref:Probable binuclear zinc cluster transcription factor that regulates the ratio between aurofusarin and rubrofusarin biosynthesis n=1 Tax=Rhynchosporium secalis TaxID=38038 RepID=A0A1E1MDY1_RHYSE|nr:probable binuclear zinc cluster transcription factor that regulates the ratio between aurofusarin and rubrofusarin biosynthesis [Rhynchosporium secalis]